MTPFDLTGKKAFVTGASRGIGQAIAVALAQAGADVAVAARSEEGLAGTAKQIADCGREVSNRVAAEFTVESGEEAASNLLQAAPHIDAIWNHDDDQGVGVLAAIKNANRSEFFMVGGAGSANAMREIQSGNSVLKASEGVATMMISFLRAEFSRNPWRMLLASGWEVADGAIRARRRDHVECQLRDLSGHATIAKVNEHEVVVGSAAHDLEP